MDGKEKYNNKEFLKCFEKLKGLKEAQAFPENMATIEYFDAKQLFDEGKAAMFGTGQWDCAEFDKNIGDKIGFFWGPKFTDTEQDQDVAMKVPSAPIGVSAAAGKDDPDLHPHPPESEAVNSPSLLRRQPPQRGSLSVRQSLPH